MSRHNNLQDHPNYALIALNIKRRKKRGDIYNYLELPQMLGEITRFLKISTSYHIQHKSK